MGLGFLKIFSVDLKEAAPRIADCDKQSVRRHGLVLVEVLLVPIVTGPASPECFEDAEAGVSGPAYVGEDDDVDGGVDDRGERGVEVRSGCETVDVMDQMRISVSSVVPVARAEKSSPVKRYRVTDGTAA